MAGKADLVNSIVDSVEGYAAPKLAYYDGWGAAESAADAPYDPGNPAPGGSLALAPLGGGAG